MNRSHRALLGVGILVIAAIAAPAAALPSDGPVGPASQVEESPEAAGNETADAPAAPGAQFSAAVEVHEAEVDGEMDDRTFGIRIARAASNDSKAAVVGDRVQSLGDRLAELRDRKERLEEEYAAGNVSEARYRAEATGLAARSEVLARQANATRDATAGLPREALEARNVDVDAIETIRRNASEMTGPEVAETARTIGGPGIGGGLGDPPRGPPSERPGAADRDDAGPPTVPGTDRGPDSPGLGNVDAGQNRTAVGPPASTATAPGELGLPGQEIDLRLVARGAGSLEVPGQ